MRADKFHVGMRVKVIEGTGTIVEEDWDEYFLTPCFKVRYDTPIRSADATGYPVLMSAAWYRPERMVPDIATIRDERIKSIME